MQNMMILKRVFSAVALVALAACGGGGGSAGGPPGGSTDPTITVSVAPNVVTAASPGTVSATVKTSSGAAIPNQVVQFSTTSGLGKFSPASALTNETGVATAIVTPATTTTAGADSVVATATVGGASLTASAGFQLTASNVTVTGFTSDLGTNSLSPYGQTTLTVTLSAAAQGNAVNVGVTSACVTSGLATLTPTTATTSTGTATFTLRDNGCGANLRDTLQATVSGSSSTASLQINLVPPTVASISFVSATPDTIFLRGSGFVENSTVTFQVRDAAGNGVRGQSVSIDPTTLAGGIQIDDKSQISDFPFTKLSDNNGNVIVRVNAGTVPTPVRIRASMIVNGVPIATVSSALAIAVGLPSQLNFSLSQGTINIEGYSRDGTSNTYTIIASDRLGNPVPDGTAINFVTEGGQVQSIRQTATTNGLSRAVANFQTSSPVPTDGRVTVLAYALGEKSFLDGNGDNVYNANELFQDLGDPYLDRLFNGFFGSTNNQFIAQTPAGTAACAVPSSSLLALDVSMPVRPGTCTGTWGRGYVRKAIETIFSTSSADPVWGVTPDTRARYLDCSTSKRLLINPNTGSTFPAYDASGNPRSPQSYYRVAGSGIYGTSKTGSIFFQGSDANPVALNPMAAGTVLTVTGTLGMTVSVAGGSPIPSTVAPNGMGISYQFDDNTRSGVATLTLRSPSGLGTSIPVPISMDAGPGSTCP